MSSKTTTARQRVAEARAAQQRRDNRRRTITRTLVVVAIVVALLVLGYALTSGRDGDSGGTASYDVGKPGIGEQAPEFTLPATTGGQISLGDYQGSTVLLYFQEGLMCQPCWDQMRDLEDVADQVKTAGVDHMLAITTDPIDLVTRKVADDRLATPTLSDPDLTVSRAYSTNQYGMMGTSRNGHSLILVGADGTIAWRADYGGEPDYTMYVPVDQLLADLEAGRQP